jgi:uncharacterized protein (TIGR02246 family)
MIIRSDRALLIAGAAFTALMLAACKPMGASVDTAKEADGLKQSEAAWSAEMTEKNADKAAAHYTADAIVTDPGDPAMKGTDQIKAGFGAAFKDPAFTLKFTPDTAVVAKSGDLAFTSGTFEATYTDPATKKPAHGSGVYVTVYTKGADGKWMAVRDFAHGNPPPAPAAH